MSEDAIRSMFTVSPSHRLELVRSRSDQPLMALPYTSLDYSEYDTRGHLVHLYRYWETSSGRFYGGERMDGDGNILKREVKLRRSAGVPAKPPQVSDAV